jgi:hypothetical protein
MGCRVNAAEYILLLAPFVPERATMKLVGLVNRSEVPETRSGTPNPELVPVLNQIIENKDTDNYVAIEVEDKKEAERVRESLRGQLKARGFRCRAATGSKTVFLKKGGKRTGETKIKLYLYILAESPLPEEPVANGKSKATKRTKKVEETE